MAACSGRRKYKDVLWVQLSSQAGEAGLITRPALVERAPSVSPKAQPAQASARPAIGRATSSSSNAPGLCSSCMSVSHGSRSPRGSRGIPSPKLSQRCSRCSAALILICEDQPLSTTTPPSLGTACSVHARHDDLVLRRLRLMAKRGRRKRQWSACRRLPRHLDIDRNQEIQEIALTTNFTPRKCHGVKTPFQALLAELGNDVQIRFS